MDAHLASRRSQPLWIVSGCVAPEALGDLRSSECSPEAFLSVSGVVLRGTGSECDISQAFVLG